MTILAFLIAMLPTVATVQHLNVTSAADAGLNGVSLSATPEGNAINTQAPRFLPRLTLVIHVTWGTSVTMNLKLKGSHEDVAASYGFVQRCPDGLIADCTDRTWQWEVADGTDFVFDYTSNYHFVIPRFDDPADGNGTIVVTVIRGRQ